jgi:ribonucleoside-diphosphate reductase alpha chain
VDNKKIVELLDARYARDGEYSWECEDTWEKICNRVARYLFDGTEKSWSYFGRMMYNKEFIPSSPVLMNAGSEYPMMCSCFVLPIEDDIDKIMEALHKTVRIQKYGGGVGINFSPIRPEGSNISTTGGHASGPVSFMKFWNAAMDVIRQAGKRQGALMGVLNWHHPDIDRFLRAKEEEGVLPNFNLSVGLDDEFWQKLRRGDSDAEILLNAIATGIWNNGEPGLLFLDTINEKSTYEEEIMSTNPCGEVPTPAYGACCLGSINLVSCVEDGEFDWGKLEEIAIGGACILDRVIEESYWPWPEIQAFERGNWPLGVGVMGLADTLALLGLPYDVSYDDTHEFVCGVMDVIYNTVKETADKLADTYKHAKPKAYLSIAPTGSIAMLAGGVSYSIEPRFYHYVIKTVEQGTFKQINPVLEDAVWNMEGRNLTEQEKHIVKTTGSVEDMETLSEHARKVLRTALEIHPLDHLKMQDVIQRYVDHSVSKTINLPSDTTIDDIETYIVYAHSLGLKGLTMYRSGSREDEVISCPLGGDCD